MYGLKVTVWVWLATGFVSTSASVAATFAEAFTSPPYADTVASEVVSRISSPPNEACGLVQLPPVFDPVCTLPDGSNSPPRRLSDMEQPATVTYRAPSCTSTPYMPYCLIELFIMLTCLAVGATITPE